MSAELVPPSPARSPRAVVARREPVRIAPRMIDPAGRPRWVSDSRPKSADRRSIPALDGVRGVAIALVLLGHGGIPGLGGGFIGVDVFFVLSGFLITSLLLDELARTGRISATAFWIRRAKRLLPALLVMVLAVVAASELFSPDAVAGLRDDAVAAFFWVANWNFVARNTDYFAQGGASSPLEHTWSLGVEEQFYLFWPLALIGLAVLLAVRAKRRLGFATVNAVRTGVVALAAGGALLSAVASVMLIDDNTINRVYFGTDTRVQALLVGAAAAALLVRDWSSVSAGRFEIQPRWRLALVRILSVLGLAVLAMAAHLATGSAGDFRHGGLALISVAAVVVIVAVAFDHSGPVAKALSWRPLVWLGTISYGVYLWHWPVFLIINGERTGWSGLSLFVVRCAVTLALAAASWRLVEQPVQRWRPIHVRLLPLSGATVATAAAVTILVLPAAVAPGEVSSTAASSAASVETLRRPVPPGTPRPHTVSVFGDSIAWTLMRYLPPTPGIEFVDRTTIGCGIAKGGPYRSVGEELPQKPECDVWQDRWANRVAYDRPDVVLLMIGRWEVVDRVHDGEWTHIGDDDYDEYLKSELRQALQILGSTGARVVVTTMPYTRRGEKADGSLYPEDRPARVDQWNSLLRNVVDEYPGISVVDLNEKLAPRNVYTATVDGIRVRSDGVHLTPEGVEWLVPWLEEFVR